MNKSEASKCDRYPATQELTDLRSSRAASFSRASRIKSDARHARATSLITVLSAVLSLMTIGGGLLRRAEVINPTAGRQKTRTLDVTYQAQPVDLIDSNAGPRLNVSPSFQGESERTPDVNSPMLEMGSELDVPRGRAHLLRVQGPGRCWNPHPGQFRTWPGQQNGCAVQVWRQFQDGCTHFQWYNKCNNIWDPQIYWTYCIH